MTQFNIEYVKNKTDFLKTLENSDNLNLKNVQNYVPLYDKFFVLNNTNYNNINLNQRNQIVSITDRPSFNEFNCKIVDSLDSAERETKVFVKFSPLLDPIKYLVGKYDHTDVNIFNLPKIDNNNSCHAKVQNHYNSAYTDSFFSYLTSKLLNDTGFVHGLDFYGSYLANLKDYKVNIFDDMEYLAESPFFNTHKNSLFTIDEAFYDMVCESDSRDRKKRLQFGKEIDDSNVDIELLGVNDTSTNKQITLNDVSSIKEIDSIVSSNSDSKMSCHSHTTCSSRSSNTTDGDGDGDGDGSDDNSSEEDSEDCSETITSSMIDDEEEQIFTHIEDFPVDMICLEACKETLDAYMMDKDIDPDEWVAILMQINMQLITYQKVFDFTHNDLHTNNVMCVETDKPYIYYCFNSTYYKVPSFGRIWKIIDFGRSIYKFNGKTICSDSFAPGEDAATQYNCEPFFNADKARLEPNHSFDLCRLGCSLFDYFLDDPEDILTYDELDDVQQLVVDWCTDDKGKNILYKKNGEERYPEFKLYKMIARNVHNHTPVAQLERKQFSCFKISRKKLKKNHMKYLINIDNLEDQTKSNGNDDMTEVSVNN